MSMIGNYVMVDEDIIQKVLSGELSADEVLYDEDDNEQEGFLDIDKSWHAIHFTLTGAIDEGDENDPLSKAVLHNQLLGTEDVGYGPPMYLPAEVVKEVDSALKAVSADAFAAKFDVRAMRENGIYPVMADENADEFLTYCLAYFVEMKAFFEKAARNGQCVIFFIN